MQSLGFLVRLGKGFGIHGGRDGKCVRERAQNLDRERNILSCFVSIRVVHFLVSLISSDSRVTLGNPVLLTRHDGGDDVVLSTEGGS